MLSFERFTVAVVLIHDSTLCAFEGGELFTHTKVTNPGKESQMGYWWTCAAHTASPNTRILAPAELVTVETYVGAPLRREGLGLG